MAALTVGGYFGAYTVWGARGLLALEATQAELGMEQQRLAELKEAQGRLRHRIELMDRPDADLDLVEELARSKLMAAAPDQAAIARDRTSSAD